MPGKPNEHTGLYAMPDDRAPRRLTVLGRWRDLSIAVRALHALVAARFPLGEGLLHLSQDAPNRALWHVFYWLHREIQGGVPLHVALGNRPEFFPPFCVDLVRAGEESGQLEAALADLQQQIAESIELRRAIAWQCGFLGEALLLPSILVGGIMVFVAPQIAAVVEATGGAPSELLAFAMRLHNAGATIALITAALGIPVFWLAMENSFIRGGFLAREFGMLSAWIPGLGALMRKRHLAAAAAMLGRLLRAGAPLPRALRTAAEASSAVLCAHSLRRIADRVEAGQDLRESMARESWVLPASFRTLVELGEQSGHLPEALLDLAALYRNQTRLATRVMLEIGIPLLVCLNGALVFVVYGGIFTTIMQLSTLIQ